MDKATPTEMEAKKRRDRKKKLLTQSLTISQIRKLKIPIAKEKNFINLIRKGNAVAISQRQQFDP
jgi:hypothetical protein